jgi:hypothetical protein
VRKLIGICQQQPGKRKRGFYVAARLDKAARGADAADVAVPPRMVLGMEGVACRPMKVNRIPLSVLVGDKH